MSSSIYHEQNERCPRCGGCPDLRRLEMGYVAYCADCRWVGRTVDIEWSADAAIEHFNNKARAALAEARGEA